ncbi:putative polygalacturonase [Lupinus albus]|uniref:Putative polygalacturonase n=1 Tax=Lupinus albus TaxID=3870 RepID=A0A6A4R9C1_LUPAL|nr:putative polygalacturonase [Lupinus albus]
MRLSTTTFFLFLVLATTHTTQAADIDIKKFGGAPNGDITQALVNAWKQACATTSASRILIPSGTYKMRGVDLKGPCKAPIEIKVDGTIQAPADPKQLNGAEQWVKIGYASHITISGQGIFDGQGANAWKQNDCNKNTKCERSAMNFGFYFLNHTIVRGITSKDSKNFHMNILSCNNFTLDGYKAIAPADSANTDGVHIGRSTNVKVINSKLATGDDCVSLGDANTHLVVQNVECGPGHGISVGSLGYYENEGPVVDFLVKNVTLKNTDNGVRIKSWPSTSIATTVTNMRFEDITMVNVANPIIIDQEYCPWNQCSKKAPSKVKISKVSFKNIKGTSSTKEGVVLICSKSIPCEGVELSEINLTFNGAPAIAVCSNVKPKIIGKAPACTAATNKVF